MAFINLLSKLAVPTIVGVGLVQASIYDGKSPLSPFSRSKKYIKSVYIQFI
jgi:hypothetical protein